MIKSLLEEHLEVCDSNRFCAALEIAQLDFDFEEPSGSASPPQSIQPVAMLKQPAEVPASLAKILNGSRSQ